MSAYIDARGEDFKTVHVYDAGNRLVKTDYVGMVRGAETTLTETRVYDPLGLMTSMIGVGGSDYVTRYTHDALGRTTEEIDPIGESQKWTYDRYGNVLSLENVFGKHEFQYDGQHRIEVETDPFDFTTRYDYPTTNQTIVTDKRDNQTTFTYDAFGKLTEELDAKGNQARYQYDEVGNMERFTDKNGNVTEIKYDARNLILQQTEAFGTEVEATTTYSYDDAGRRTGMTDPRGEYYTTTYDYDLFGSNDDGDHARRSSRGAWSGVARCRRQPGDDVRVRRHRQCDRRSGRAGRVLQDDLRLRPDGTHDSGRPRDRNPRCVCPRDVNIRVQRRG